MGKHVQIIVLDKGLKFGDGRVFFHDSVRDKIDSYSKGRIADFKKKLAMYFNKVLDAYEEFDWVISEGIDRFADEVFARYEAIKDRIDSSRTRVSKNDVSAFEKLQPMMSDDDMKRLGIDREAHITELKEFKKELLMENYTSMNKENNNRRSRGTLYIWMSVLISVLLMGILIGINIIQR